MIAPPEENVRAKPARRRRVMTAIMVTVVAHLMLALFAAVRGVLPVMVAKPELVAEAPGPDREQQAKVKKEEIRQQVEQVLAQAPSMTRVMRSEALAMTAVPEMRDLLQGPVGLGEGSLGVGFGAGPDTRMGRGAVFFGQKVTGRPGVVFDVSGSMHEYVPLVIEEINRAFRQAMVVCCNPANLVPMTSKPEAVPYREATIVTSNIPSIFTEAARSMHQDLLDLPNCWFLKREFSHLGGGIEYLLNDGVTEIFVFSDFEDMIIPEYVASLADRAKAAKVKISLEVLDKARYEKQALMELCRRTGGKFSEGELLARARRKR